MLRSDFDVVECITFSKFSGNLVDVWLQISLVLKPNVLINHLFPRPSPFLSPLFLTHIFRLCPLLLWQETVGQRTLLCDTDTVSAIVGFTGFSDFQTTKSFLHNLVFLGNQVVVAKTFFNSVRRRNSANERNAIMLTDLSVAGSLRVHLGHRLQDARKKLAVLNKVLQSNRHCKSREMDRAYVCVVCLKDPMLFWLPPKAHASGMPVFRHKCDCK